MLLFQAVKNIYRNSIQLFSDGYKIITQKENFILGELADRASQSEDGYASTYLGLPFLKLASFHVLTGEKYLKEGVSYGEYQESKPSAFDPKARSLFDPLKDFLGNTSIINMNGPEVSEERKAIKNYLTMSSALAASLEVFAETAQNWSSHKSINDQICFACTQVIASAWFNCKNIPEEIVPLLKKAERYVFNRDKVSDSKFKELKDEFRLLNDTYMKKNEEAILSKDNYLKHMLRTRGVSHLKDLNGLFALVVEGNITTVLTCAVLQIASNKQLQAQLKEELQTLEGINISSAEGYEKVKRLKILNNIYLESLRLFSPAPPLVRYASKQGKIADKKISARSYLFMPLRRVMYDPKKWDHPYEFDPTRHERSATRVNFYPLTPFSTGPRVCPASFGFAEALFKIALVSIFKGMILSLTSHDSIELIPVNAKEPRLRQEYFGKLTKASDTSPGLAKVSSPSLELSKTEDRSQQITLRFDLEKSDQKLSSAIPVTVAITACVTNDSKENKLNRIHS
ncbi:MAG: cytochrome P450 [Gammaproteobacteria bacterium]|jgi:cytochrome P450|nr:cytochrome P450 [Gammaproteobacteria bacterium]